jgi:hypothetical protein
MAFVLRCHGNVVFQKTLPAIRSVIGKKTLEEKVNTLFENRFMTFIQNLSQQEGSPPLHLLAPQAATLSSMCSTASLGTWHSADDIMVDAPCCLHILLGRVGKK